jgi:branched-chain amino acid transport system substrate-binding protein
MPSTDRIVTNTIASQISWSTNHNVSRDIWVEGLGDKAALMIVAEDAYDIAETTIDSHVVKMKSLNADVFVDITTPKFAAQAIRKAAEIGWPLHFLIASALPSVPSSGQPASRRRRTSFRSPIMDALDPQWKDDPGMKAFDEFLAKDYPEGNRVMIGYNVAPAAEAVRR